MILLFTKSPELGRVKTRLQPHIGEENCLALQRWLIQRSVQVLKQSGLPFEICVDGDEEKLRALFSDRLADISVNQQRGVDLGARMKQAFVAALSENEYAIAVGSDCIEIDAEQLHLAKNQLLGNDLVIGPAKDGGYTLIGVSQRIQTDEILCNLFESIDWGTDRVLQQTLRRVDQASVSCKLLKETSDLDTFTDLQNFAKREPELAELLS